jgi:hypothetical protein
LKEKILQTGMITAEEGDLLQQLLEKENSVSVKRGAYHALCGKKFLANNYQPGVARQHILKAISYKPYRADSYLLYLVSFLPAPFIGRLHRLLNQKMNA